jgi:hypothetical protein
MPSEECFVYPFTNKWVGLDRWYPGPWNRTGGPRDRRSHCVAVVCGRPPAARHVFWDFARPVQHDVDGAGRRRVEDSHSSRTRFTSIAAFWFVDKAVRRRARIGSSRAIRESGNRSHARQILGRVSIVLALVVAGTVWWIAVPTHSRREAFSIRRRRHHCRGPSRSVVLRRWLVQPRGSRGNVTSRFAAPPGANLRILLPEARSYALTLRTAPVEPFPAGTTRRACVIEWDSPRRSRARMESGTHRPVPDPRFPRACSLLATNVWKCALTPRSNCGTLLISAA